MQKENLSKEFESFIHKVLDESGKIALNYFRQIRNLSLKGDLSPVTLADKDIENYIRSKII
jgi:fructose-1,6-bisphosphatase/inositol monophosphatase family enzyme